MASIEGLNDPVITWVYLVLKTNELSISKICMIVSFTKENGYRSTYDCLSMRIVLPYQFYLSPFHLTLTGLIFSCSNREVKILSFSHLMALRYSGYTTYGIRATVKTLGPNWAQNAATCFTLELHVY